MNDTQAINRYMRQMSHQMLDDIINSRSLYQSIQDFFKNENEKLKEQSEQLSQQGKQEIDNHIAENEEVIKTMEKYDKILNDTKTKELMEIERDSYNTQYGFAENKKGVLKKAGEILIETNPALKLGKATYEIVTELSDKGKKDQRTQKGFIERETLASEGEIQETQQDELSITAKKTLGRVYRTNYIFVTNMENIQDILDTGETIIQEYCNEVVAPCIENDAMGDIENYNANAISPGIKDKIDRIIKNNEINKLSRDHNKKIKELRKKLDEVDGQLSKMKFPTTKNMLTLINEQTQTTVSSVLNEKDLRKLSELVVENIDPLLNIGKKLAHQAGQTWDEKNPDVFDLTISQTAKDMAKNNVWGFPKLRTIFSKKFRQARENVLESSENLKSFSLILDNTPLVPLINWEGGFNQTVMKKCKEIGLQFRTENKEQYERAIKSVRHLLKLSKRITKVENARYKRLFVTATISLGVLLMLPAINKGLIKSHDEEVHEQHRTMNQQVISVEEANKVDDLKGDIMKTLSAQVKEKNNPDSLLDKKNTNSQDKKIERKKLKGNRKGSRFN